ncbi:DNA-directed RNA polymerase subunit delta [Fervidibacillus halotolerans]|uniref:Probable DNA-directed RNA polymerase subunit delta n=1 Tax=Fervidibacillus halotolerans TaxID=2980027 RepID=A0A9E8LZ26_9BACI|nr:DNA-directed RNA polymerase subunit delta [Fervidibacillus halotolerans]WAA12201.1 DNA-directed RNA polymerase subunit delta [Fervidibacillus halotolerans]
MSLEQLSLEQLQELSLIEIAYEILSQKKQPLPFSQLVDEIVAIKNISKEEMNEKIAQFYTDLNFDGRFMNVGANTWGIKAWYPMDKIEDEIVPNVRPKKKKAKPVDDLDDIDEMDEESLDFDDEFEELDEDEFLDEDEEKDLDEEDDDFEDDELIDDDFEDDKLIDDEDLLIDEDFVDDGESDELDDEFEDDPKGKRE